MSFVCFDYTYITNVRRLKMHDTVDTCDYELLLRRLHSSAPEYLWSQLQRVSYVHVRRRLRSSSSTALLFRAPVELYHCGRGFSAAATPVWNSLPEAVRSSIHCGAVQNVVTVHAILYADYSSVTNCTNM